LLKAAQLTFICCPTDLRRLLPYGPSFYYLLPSTPRQYFGNQVGFYLAYLNALTCWLLAPAATSGLFLWTLGNTGLDSKGEFLGVFVTREHVRHNKSGITHRGKTRISH
jgi:hypothetical protein